MTLQHTMTMAASYAEGRLLAGRIGAIGLVIFNQPEKRNAISIEMWDGICEALDLLAADDGVRVVIYAGAGEKAFCAGNDISQFASRRADAAANAAFSRLLDRGRDMMIGLPKPSIACIQGYCMGGGLAIALRADVRIAAANAVFGIPATRLGIAYGIEPMERLVALIGPARARLMLYSARKFTAHDAFAMGLVESVATDDVAAETLDLARTIAENAPLSVRAAKFTIEEVLKAPGQRNGERIAAYTRSCMDSADYREGRAAFMEKRRPNFVGA